MCEVDRPALERVARSGCEPWLADVFKVSADPDFKAKLHDVLFCV